MCIFLFYLYHLSLLYLNPNIRHKNINNLTFSSLLFVFAICPCHFSLLHLNLTLDKQTKTLLWRVFSFTSTLTFSSLSLSYIIRLRLINYFSSLFIFIVFVICCFFFNTISFLISKMFCILIFHSFKWKHYLSSPSFFISISLPMNRNTSSIYHYMRTMKGLKSHAPIPSSKGLTEFTLFEAQSPLISEVPTQLK